MCAVFKPSNFYPDLQEVDLSQENTFSCQINTSGEPILAYKIKILSARGDSTIYESSGPISLDNPVKNQDILYISDISTSDIPALLNGKDYQ